MSAMLYWYGMFAILLIAFLLILWKERDRRWLYYMIAGSILGFFIDIVSFTYGYYTYPDFYLLPILGLPFSMTLAEGFSVAITIWLYERPVKRLLRLKQAF